MPNIGNHVDAIFLPESVNTSTSLRINGGGLTVSGVSTFQDNVNLGYDDKLRFGDNQDLQIYSTGVNSVIREGGSGNLKILGTNIVFKNSGETKTYADFNNGGSVELYYDNSKKFETTSTGIDVSGNLTLTGELRGPASFVIDPAAVGDNTGTVVIKGDLQVDGTTTTINSTTLTVDDKNIVLASGAADAAAADGAGITIDGATATLLYKSTPDAWTFNKNVGIGTNNPGAKLHVVDNNLVGTYLTLATADSPTVSIVNQATNVYARIAGGNYATASSVNLDLASHRAKNKDIQGGWRLKSLTGATASSGSGSRFQIVQTTFTSSNTITEDSAALTINNNGNVGIGTESPSNLLHIKRDTTANTYAIIENTTAGNAGINLKNNAGDWNIIANADLRFIDNTASSDRMRIDSSGRLLVGTTSASSAGAFAQYGLIKIQGNSSSSTSVGILNIARGQAATSITTDTDLGVISFTDSSGYEFGTILCEVDATPGSSDYPGRLVFSTTANGMSSPTERMRITNAGNIEFNTTYTDPQAATLSLRPGYLASEFGGVGLGCKNHSGSSNDGLAIYGHDGVSIQTAGNNERMRIDSSGRLLVGTSTSRIVEDHSGNGPQGKIQIEGTNSDGILSIISAGTADAYRCGTLSLGRHRNSTIGGTPTVVQSGDSLGAICFAGGDGTDMRTKGAKIVAEVDGTPGANDMPGRLVFSTTASGASSPAERLRIDSSGQLLASNYKSNGVLTIGFDANGNNINNDYIAFVKGASTEYMRLDGSGNVGIGTNNPAVKLDVDGSLQLRAVGNYTTYATRIYSRLDSTHCSVIESYLNNNTAFEMMGSYADSGGANPRIVLGAGGQNVGINTTNPGYNLEVNGSFAATTKSFIIDHPTKPGMKLRHGSLEGPENGVYVRGRSYLEVINLPDYWTKLIDPDSITVALTPIGPSGAPRVERIENNKVYVFSEDSRPLDYFYMINAERVDVDPLEVEIPDTTN